MTSDGYVIRIGVVTLSSITTNTPVTPRPTWSRSHSATPQRTLPGPLVPYKRRSRVLCRPPNLRSKCRRRRNRICHQSSCYGSTDERQQRFAYQHSISLRVLHATTSHYPQLSADKYKLTDTKPQTKCKYLVSGKKVNHGQYLIEMSNLNAS